MSFTYRASVPLGTTGLAPTVQVGTAGAYATAVNLAESVAGSGTYEADVTLASYDTSYTLLYADGQGNSTIETVRVPQPQTGDVYARVGANGAGLTALGDTRLAYLDSSVAGVLAAVLNVQNGSFVSANVPPVLERPDAGSETFQIVVLFADETGAPKNLDSGNPTVTLVNNAATDLSSRLGSWSNPATGKYTANYTNTSTDALDDLHWEFDGTVNSKLRRFVGTTQLVDTTAVDFTSADRTKLNAIQADYARRAGDYATVGAAMTLTSDYDAAKTAGDATAANQATILARLGAFTGTGVNTVLGFLRAMFRSDLTAPTDLASGGTATSAADSLQAIAAASGGGTDPLTNAPSDYAEGQIGHLIGDIKAKTDLITVDNVQIVQSAQSNIAGNRTLLRISERYILNFFGLGPIGSSEQMWFTIKTQLTDSDNAALVYIKRTGGLIRINGQAASTSGHGSITVTNATTGDGTITLSELETINLAPSNLMPVYEIKVLDPTYGPQARIQGECSIVYDVNRQTS